MCISHYKMCISSGKPAKLSTLAKKRVRTANSPCSFYFFRLSAKSLFLFCLFPANSLISFYRISTNSSFSTFQSYFLLFYQFFHFICPFLSFHNFYFRRNLNFFTAKRHPVLIDFLSLLRSHIYVVFFYIHLHQSFLCQFF